MSGATRFFDAIAPRYDREYVLDGQTSRARMATILETLQLAPGTQVLDLGVGTGRELPPLLDAGLDVTGVDASEEMLAICARRARPIPLVRADFYEPLPFGDARFGAVLALHGTLAHPPDATATERLVAEVARVIAPDGWFVIEVPSTGLLADLERAPTDDGTRRIERTGEGTLRHFDRKANIAIDGVVRSDSQWRSLLSPRFSTTTRALSSVEQIIFARALAKVSSP